MKSLKLLRQNQQGILLIELVLAIAVFGMIALIVLSGFTYGRESTVISGDNSRGAQVANQAIEAVHNIAQASYANLSSYTDGTDYYLNTSGSQWSLSTSPTTINSIYTPKVVFSAGPSNSRQATVTVTWRINSGRTGTAVATTYLTNWQSSNLATVKGGVLVYANGGTTSNLIMYRQLQTNGLWTTPLALPQAGGNNYVARSVKLYPAQSGNNKVVIARFYDGSRQYIYGYVWNGSSWATPQLLSSWTSSSALDSGNFSGTYMANGSFITVYSDNTNRPKYNTYTSGTWSSQGSMGTIDSSSSVNPTSMIIRARPGTNEVMLALLDEEYQILTAYYNNGSWSSYTTHATNGTSNGTHNVDFDWSEAQGGIYGALIYTVGNGQRSPTFRVFTANGSGSGTWGLPMKPTDQPAGSIVYSVAISGQPTGSANFIGCDKDNASLQRIYCYTLTPTSVSVPGNPILSPKTAPGGQQTMDLGFEDLIGTIGIAGYSDGSTSAAIKRWDSATNVWDPEPPLGTPVAAANIDKTRLIPMPGQNDAMLLQIDSRNNLYSIMYKASTHQFYTTPTGYSWTIHNANGPSVGAKWFDFGWDN